MPIDLCARKVMPQEHHGLGFIEMGSRPVCMPSQSIFNDGARLPYGIIGADQVSRGRTASS